MRLVAGLVAVAALTSMTASVANGAPGETAAAKAPVARVTAPNGQVQVNRGGGFAPSGQTVLVNAGDRVLAPSGSNLVYADGCVVPMQAGQPVEALPQSPCAATGVYQDAAEGPATGAATSPYGGTMNRGFLATSGGAMLVGAGLGGVTTAVVIESTNDDDNDAPVSP